MTETVGTTELAGVAAREASALLDEVEAVIGPAYLVGGSVRDLVMGRACQDHDVATPLPAEDVEARIRAAGRRPYLLGKRFGTIGMTLGGRKVEITTFRARAYATRSRGPAVEFLPDLEADLGRRDFTMNAMAMRAGVLIDPFGGAADIASRTVRCVGDPRARFAEDPLRILRAARFVSQFGFEAAPDTVVAMRRLAHRVLEASRERWSGEFDRLLTGTDPAAGLRLLADTGVLRFILPELALQIGYEQNSPWHARSLFDHTLGVVAGVPADVTLRWAALLHDAGKPYARTEKPGRSTYVGHERIGAELVERTALYLRWSTERREQVRELVAAHMKAGSPLREADDNAKL